MTSGRIDSAAIVPAIPLLDELPVPILWIGSDYTIRWANRAATQLYRCSEQKCHLALHGLLRPCSTYGERCPKEHAERDGMPSGQVHAHSVEGRTQIFWVMAVPIEGGAGVLEVEMDMGSAMSRDALSGLYRREFWNEAAERARALLARIQRPYCVLFLDLDRFKQVNDCHGHDVGDRLLREVAGTLASGMRRSDVPGRYGGEEFVAFLSDTVAAEAVVVAQRLVRDIAACRVKTRDGGELSVTVSIGVHEAATDESVEEATRKADRAMYQAKARGGNGTAVGGRLAPL